MIKTIYIGTQRMPDILEDELRKNADPNFAQVVVCFAPAYIEIESRLKRFCREEHSEEGKLFVAEKPQNEIYLYNYFFQRPSLNFQPGTIFHYFFQPVTIFCNYSDLIENYQRVYPRSSSIVYCESEDLYTLFFGREISWLNKMSPAIKYKYTPPRIIQSDEIVGDQHICEKCKCAINEFGDLKFYSEIQLRYWPQGKDETPFDSANDGVVCGRKIRVGKNRWLNLINRNCVCYVEQYLSLLQKANQSDDLK